jgi:hypothetical protein
MPTWYDGTFLLLHHDPPQNTLDGLRGVSHEQVQRVLERVRPDAVQYVAKGSAGYVPYPTVYGNAIPHLEAYLLPDVLAIYREVTRSLGKRLILGYSGLVDFRAADYRHDWQRMRMDYVAYPNRGLCPNAGYVEELLLPQLDEIVERYEPDGIWTDADNWTVSPCYCSICAAEFQMLHDRSTPRSPSDPFWPEWLEFHRVSFRRYLERVALYLRERNPEIVYASSGAYCSHQPEPLESGLDRLCADLSPAYSLSQAGLEARLLDGRRVPFDLATWSDASARPWRQGTLPALPAYPKGFEQLAQEGGVILSNGGRWTLWSTPQADGTLSESRHEVAGQAVEFARAREAVCRGSRSDAYVAVLHAAETHRRAGNGLYDPGPSLDRIRGAHQALVELHHPHDVLTAQGLLWDLDRYRVVVLPEQTALPPEVDAPLTEWVRRGGRLIAAGLVSPRVIEDLPTFALEEVLGVRWTGRTGPEGFVSVGGLPIRIAVPVQHVSLAGAEVVQPFLTSGIEGAALPAESPAITRSRLGDGEGFYVAFDLFTGYHRHRYPGLRELFGQVLEQVLPSPPLLTKAPPTLEIVVRAREGEIVVHFANHAPGSSLAQNNAWVERVPPTPPFSLTLEMAERPARVRLEPGSVEVEWSHTGSALTVFVPPVHLHAALVITHGEAG